MDDYIRKYSNEPFMFFCNVCQITLKPLSMNQHKLTNRHKVNVHEYLQQQEFKQKYLTDNNK